MFQCFIQTNRLETLFRAFLLIHTYFMAVSNVNRESTRAPTHDSTHDSTNLPTTLAWNDCVCFVSVSCRHRNRFSFFSPWKRPRKTKQPRNGIVCRVSTSNPLHDRSSGPGAARAKSCTSYFKCLESAPLATRPLTSGVSVVSSSLSALSLTFLEGN